jgi:DNA-directed RNA polymerase II subunit RPB1
MDTIVYSYDSNSVKHIDHIDFDILGSKEIGNMSVIDDPRGISIAELYDNTEAKKGGLIDPRLGTTSIDTVCATCGFPVSNCDGHFGHIELAEHVYHVGYLQAPYLPKILSCICLKCSKILLRKNEKEISEIKRTKFGKDRLSYVRALTKSVTYCSKTDYGCGALVPKIKVIKKKKTAEISIITEFDVEGQKEDGTPGGKKKITKRLTPAIVYEILKHISDDDCELLGIDPKRSRPENMILKTFPVPPVQVRPSVKGDFAGGQIMEDSLTRVLANIVKENLRIIKNKENLAEGDIKRDETSNLLQYHTLVYIDNSSLSLPKAEQQKGVPIKSLTSRIKSKKGRIRDNLMGKHACS